MFQHILAPLDGSTTAECTFPHIVAAAKAFDAQVTLLQVLEHSAARGPRVDPLDWQLRKIEAQTYLHRFQQRMETAGLSADSVLLEGRPATCIVNFVQTHAIDLLVLSTHGASGLSPWNMSSVVQKVVQRVNRSVMLVRAYQPLVGGHAEQPATTMRYRRILLPLDGSQRAEYALAAAQRLCRYHNAECILVHVVQKPAMPRRMPLSPTELALVDQIVACNRRAAEAYLVHLHERWEGPLQTRILTSEDVAGTLHGLVDTEEIDLVVLNAHGYSGKGDWPYGAITSSFILHGTTPLLFVQDLPQIARPIEQAEAIIREQQGHGRWVPTWREDDRSPMQMSATVAPVR